MFDPRYITTRRVQPIALILRKLGFAAFGPGAGELMGKIQVAILAGALYTLLRDAVFTHPTMSESLGMLFARVPKRRDAAVEKLNTMGCPLPQSL
jgi:hypothetical protein